MREEEDERTRKKERQRTNIAECPAFSTTHSLVYATPRFTAVRSLAGCCEQSITASIIYFARIVSINTYDRHLYTLPLQQEFWEPAIVRLRCSVYLHLRGELSVRGVCSAVQNVVRNLIVEFLRKTAQDRNELFNVQVGHAIV